MIGSSPLDSCRAFTVSYEVQAGCLKIFIALTRWNLRTVNKRLGYLAWILISTMQRWRAKRRPCVLKLILLTFFKNIRI